MKGLLLQCRLRRRGVGGVEEIAAIDGVDVFLGRSIWRLLRDVYDQELVVQFNGLRSGRAKGRRGEAKGRREGAWDILRHGVGQGWARKGSRWLVRCRTWSE